MAAASSHAYAGAILRCHFIAYSKMVPETPTCWCTMLLSWITKHLCFIPTTDYFMSVDHAAIKLDPLPRRTLGLNIPQRRNRFAAEWFGNADSSKMCDKRDHLGPLKANKKWCPFFATFQRGSNCFQIQHSYRRWSKFLRAARMMHPLNVFCRTSKRWLRVCVCVCARTYIICMHIFPRISHIPQVDT